MRAAAKNIEPMRQLDADTNGLDYTQICPSTHRQADSNQAVNAGKHVAKSDFACLDSTCCWAPLICVCGKDCLQMVQAWLGMTVLLSLPELPPPPTPCAAAFFMASSRALFDFSPLPPPMAYERELRENARKTHLGLR
eukprot:CAMPEP_0197632042 /NCGR_PEP_ID=MMETSP1338-20131121/8984_1 /TAXON_ID=43686 ORGANISM="Pelagodinium beii, Strain RCC1491" /NCGR_SAMPLE_ID=MMETSP1338 /ASSEMBLY_ACC=CAM_ASM_000754 /LENGTH=137 /DNA_ID=CAMNT_0043203591 /DNA_START=158 /DNA_END=572 /DNA_ORIENTATION=-